MKIRAFKQPTLIIGSDPRHPRSRFVGVRDVDPDLIATLHACPQAERVLRSLLQVRVVGAAGVTDEDLPDVLGYHQFLEDGVRFIPHFPFESGVRFRATFDSRHLGRPEFSEVLTLEFSFPAEIGTGQTKVQRVFPSGNSLPENTLRFYVCFSNPMQRGCATEHISLLGPDGQPAPDVLYRPPVELWDNSLTHLTVLLDPGRLKRWVGPNRMLGPPLTAGQAYTLAIGSGMIDASGHPLRENFYKTFRASRAIREPVATERWTVLTPMAKSHQPLELLFPRPLDWAQLWHAITVASERDQLIDGQIAINRGEKRWSFTPKSAWNSGAHYIRVASSLEDVCGNNLSGAFDRPLRTFGDLANAAPSRSIAFHVS